MDDKSCLKCPRYGMKDVKSHVLQSISIKYFCSLLCIASFPEKRRVEEDDLDSLYEASDRVKLVR